MSCIQLLLDRGVGVDQRNLEFKTALHEAAQFGQSEAVRLLLRAGAQVDSLKRADWTPIMLAATKQGNMESVRTLLEAGADPRVVNKDGWTPLHLAVRTGDGGMVDLLMEASPETLGMVSNNGRSVLHTASLAGHEPMVRRLLGTSADVMVNSQDSCGNTALMDAARAGHLACVRLLASHPGTDLETEDRMVNINQSEAFLLTNDQSQGRTVVEVAAQAGACEVLQFLRLELGVDVTSGLSLHAAAREGQAEAVRLLVSCGAEVDREDIRGRTIH